MAWVAPYLPGTPAGSSPRRAGTSRFCIARNTRVPRVPLRTNPTASLTREWKGPTRLAPGHIHAHSSRCHALQGLRGPNRGRRAHQGPALRDPLWQPAVPARALRGVLTSARANRHVRRSLVAHVRRTEDTGSISGRLRMPAPSRGKACGVGTWEGGWDRLASAFRVRLPSVQSARLQRSSFAAPFAHQALDSSACAGEAALFLTSSSSTTSFRKSGFIVA